MAQTKAHDLEAFCATCPTVQEVTIVLQALGLELTFHMDAVISPEYAQLPPLPAQYHYRDRHGSEVVFLAGHDADLDGVRLPAHASFLDISRRGCRSRLVDCPYDGYYVVTCLATCITTVPGCRIRRWRHQMQEVHIICTWDQLQPMEQALE